MRAESWRRLGGDIGRSGRAASSDLGQREVHFAGGVFEDAEGGGFLGEPLRVGFGVGVVNTEEDEEAAGDLGGDDTVDGDAGGGDALDDGAHERS